MRGYRYRKKKSKKGIYMAIWAVALAAALYLPDRGRLLKGFFPVGAYGADPVNGAALAYETQVESDLTYEMILLREARDENYVDHKTGQVVMSDDDRTGTVASDGGGGEQAAESAPGAPAGEQTETDGGEQANGSGSRTTAGQDIADGDAGQAAETSTGSPANPGATQKAVNYSFDKLRDFDYLRQNFYQVDSTTTINGSQLNVDALLGKDMRLSHDASAPQIIIYHTHSQEGYADSIPGDAATSVVGVGDYLAQLLTEQYGLNVIHHKGAYDVGDRDHAYSNAAPAIEKLLADNPSVEVVIDLHRDGVAETTRLVTEQNGVPMAQVMFFNGLSRTTSTGDIDYLYNPYIADNLAFSFQAQLKAAEYYPGFTRRIYLKGYRFNMHYCPKTMLVEVGAQTNTFEEAKNAMVPLADVLYKVLTGPI